VALEKQGDISGAEKVYRALLKQDPSHFRTLYHLAGIAVGNGHFEEAVRFLRKALNQEPKSASAHAMLAHALQNLERHDEAMERARRAIALDPALADAYATLARELADLGRYDEAVRASARALELAPTHPSYYYQWGYITRWSAGDPRLATLEALAEKSASLPIEEQCHLHFALGKAYADCGDVERALRQQIRGGALKRQTLLYDEAATLRQLGELTRVFDGEWIGRHRGVGDPSSLPVFILGMPRSGTTLVEQILASHPKVAALGERRILNEALAQIRGSPEDVPSPWSAKELQRLGALYLEGARAGASAAAGRISDKVTSNFRFVGLIHGALPNARIIHTRRDPVDTCLSIFSLLFSGPQQPFSYDLGELGRYYRAYERVMAHWHEVLPPGVMIDVQYEEVVNDLERQARRIVAHCGLEWNDACLEFHKTDRAVRTASHAQVRQPIYRSSIGRPRPPREILQPLLEELGET
jgi:tetratricopeptide (TPR) repeat protein